jgi:hypothetical protein
MKKKNTLK